MSLMHFRPTRGDVCRPAYRFMNRSLENFFDNDPTDSVIWGPNVDIVEDKENFEIQAELPGVKMEDVKLTLDDNVLTLSGERRQEVKEDKNNYHRVERSYGKFSRSFSLHNSIQSDKVRASFEDGVLRVILPKAEQAKTRTIEIQSK